MVEIKFTKEQYEDLIKLAYLGNWMINAIRTHDRIDRYEDLEQYIFSFAKKAGLDRYVHFDSESKKSYPSKELEQAKDIEGYINDYDNENFWDELIDRLARRDFIQKYGEDAIRKMTRKERFEKEHPFIEKYDEEFEKNGIENLQIVK